MIDLETLAWLQKDLLEAREISNSQKRQSLTSSILPSTVVFSSKASLIFTLAFDLLALPLLHLYGKSQITFPRWHRDYLIPPTLRLRMHQFHPALSL